MLQVKIDTSSIEQWARRMERNAPFAMDELRKGVHEATDAARDAIRDATPANVGITREHVVSVFRGLGAAEYEGVVKALPAPNRPENLFEMLNDGTKPHLIQPRQAVNARGKKSALKFNVGGRTLFRGSVEHPGLRPYHQVERGLEASAGARDRAYRNTIRRIVYRMRR